MFAVIKTGGRQYRVVPDDVLEIGKIAGDVGTIVQLGEVLLVGGESAGAGRAHGCGRFGCGRSAAAQARPQGHLVQEAPPQEFAPQARLSRRDHGAAHHRDPDQQQQADHRPAAEEEKPVAAAPAEGDDEAPEDREEKGARQEGRLPSKAKRRRSPAPSPMPRKPRPRSPPQRARAIRSEAHR